MHVTYAYPSDGTDRFQLFGSAISTDLGAVDHWWRGQDSTRTPRFDLATFSCAGTIGALDISDVRLAHDSSYYYDLSTRLRRLRDDLVTAGFNNSYKKYLVYYDSPRPLTVDLCGQGYENPSMGGAAGYASVFIAANLESEPFSRGCGDMEVPGDLGGYSASVAAHEMLHTFGAVAAGAPHACPTSPDHACDNALDIMEPAGSTYWLDNTYLDWGHDDYYAHSGNWWDVQDSPWLTHLNEPSYTLTITQGVGVASVVSDEPGLVCSPATSCATSWQSGSLIVLMSAAAPGFSRAVWGGGCAAAGNVPECDLTVDADTNVTLSYLRTLAAGHFSAGFVRRPSRIQATLTLNRPPAAGEASLTCGGLAGLRLASHTITHVVATCIWNVPRRFAGRRVQGRLRIGLDDGRVLAHAFTVHLPPLV